MSNKHYDVFLDNKLIGVTNFEKADAPMGVVFGRLDFISIDSGYDFFKKYCEENGIEFTDMSDDRLISTRNIPNLKAVNQNGIEIKGMSCAVSGMDSDAYEIEILGIPYPFYQEEFPHHVE